MITSSSSSSPHSPFSSHKSPPLPSSRPRGPHLSAHLSNPRSNRLDDIETTHLVHPSVPSSPMSILSQPTPPLTHRTVFRESSSWRDELMKMQGCMDQLGPKMSKFTTSPSMLSTMPLRASANHPSLGPQINSPFAIHARFLHTDKLLDDRQVNLIPPQAPQA
jgi:hypothetical protein